MNSKKIIATFLLIVLFTATVIGWGSYRLALATDTSTTEVTMEKLEEASTTESTEEASSESSTEETTTAVSTETGLVEDEDVANTPSDLTTEATTELASTENTTTEESTQTITSEDGTEFVTQDSNLVEEEVSANGKGTTIKILDKGSWGNGHWYWYTTNILPTNSPPYWREDKTESSGHVVFCLNPGATMNRGSYSSATLKHTMFKSKTSTCLINTALEWYKTQCGSLGISKLDKERYQQAQLAIWGDSSNSTSAKIIEYATYARKIQNDGSIGKFKSTTVSNVSQLTDSIGLAKPNSTDGLTYTSPASTSLKYWKHSDNMSSHKSVSITVDKGSFAGTVKTKIDEKGQIVVTLSEKPKKADRIKVLVSVTGDCMGDVSATTWVQTGNGWQNLSMGSYTGSKKFGMILSGKDVNTEAVYPDLVLEKQDDLTKGVDAGFHLYYKNYTEAAADMSIANAHDMGVVLSTGETYLMQDAKDIVEANGWDPQPADRVYKHPGAGIYYLQEVSTEDGLYNDGRIFTIEMGVKNLDGVDAAGNPIKVMTYGLYVQNTKFIPLKWTPVFYSSNNTPAYSSVTLPGIYNVNHNIAYNYSFLKRADHVTGYTGTKGNITGFSVDPNGLDNNAEFALYATADVVWKDTVLFSTGQRIYPGTIWCTNAAACSHAAEGFDHTIRFGVTSADGKRAKPDASGSVSVTGLPAGSYKFVETDCSAENLRNEQPILFSVPVEAGEETQTFQNHLLYCNLNVTKQAKQQKGKDVIPLKDAEFTLYAWKDNKKSWSSAELLYPQDWVDTGDNAAVVARTLSDDGTTLEEQREDGWIPIRTLKTDENGKLTFTQLPYGKYLVVETKAAPAVTVNGKKTYFALAEDSWRVDFTPDSGSSSYTFSNAIDYSRTFRFDDQERKFKIKLHKYGNGVVDSEKVETPYGDYKDLVFDEVSLKGFVFQVKDKDGNIVSTLETDEKGEAETEALFAGKYTVHEVVADKEYKYLKAPIEVDLETEDALILLDTKTQEIEDEFVNTKLTLYKNQEVPYITKDVIENPDKYPDVLVTDKSSAYTYNVEPLEGAVFGVYAGQDFKNYYGKVIINKGDCVGYLRTGKDGKASLDQKMLPGKYYYKEITNNHEDTLRVDENQYDFTLTLNHNDVVEDLNRLIPVLNEYKKSSVKLIKKDGDTEILLPGVEFGLYDYKNNLINRYVTDENGEIRVDLLPLQTYYFKELEALDGYYKNNERLNIVADADKMLYTITAYNDKMYDDSEDQLTDRSDFNDKLKDIAGFWAAITDNPDFEEETSITDTPKLGTSIFVNIFCSLVLLMCVAGIVVIWMPKKRK